MRTLSAAAVSLLGIVVASGGAVAATTVVGGGLAEACYEAALNDRASQANLAICDRALTEEALMPRDRVATHVNRGIMRMHLRNVNGAVADFDRASALDPQEPEAYLNKAVALMMRDDEGWRDAIPLFETALNYKTRKPEIAYYGRGMASEAAGDVKGAYRDYKRASELAPNWAEPARELTRFTVVKRGG